MIQEINLDDTLNDVDYEFSDLEGDLGILESNLENCVNVTNYDDFDELLLKKRVDQKLVQQARSCSDHACISDILTLHRAVKESNCPHYMGIRLQN